MRSTRGRWVPPSLPRTRSGRGFGRSSRRRAGRRSGFTPADAFLGVLEVAAAGAEALPVAVRAREAGSRRRFRGGARLLPVDRRVALAAGVEEDPCAPREVEVVVEGGPVGGAGGRPRGRPHPPA